MQVRPCFPMLALLVLFTAPSAAVAADTLCVGSLGPITVDNVVVPAGAICSMDGTLVTGSIRVERGASLLADSIGVVGGLLADEGHFVVILLCRSRSGPCSVAGNIQLKAGLGAAVVDMSVGADLQSERGGLFVSQGNTVGGNLQAFTNGAISVVLNRIRGGLQCTGNASATGAANVAAVKQGDCATF